MDNFEKFMIAILVAVVVVAAIAITVDISSDNKATRNCEAAGGMYVKEYRSSIYKCYKVERLLIKE